MKLFDRFDKVYCINLEHREDRKNHILSECNKYDLGEVSFFNAFNGYNLSNPYKISNGNFGLILTNIEIIKEAKNNNYKNILILEDDCYFTSEVLNINTYFDALPDDWDMLYLGGNHNTHVGNSPPIVINEKIVKLHSTLTTHFVAINNHMYDVILARLSKFDNPIDVVYTGIQKLYNVYSTSNTIAKQLNGYSDIENRVVDYSQLIK
jgi:GR25 family glycosyltransferase involved in LPS biosynthesis